jgi:hypothetical protein
MEHPVPTRNPKKSRLLLLLALPIALTLVLLLAVVARVQHTLHHAQQTVATAGHLTFTLLPLDTSTRPLAFDPVASAPGYTSGAYLGGNLYVAGPSGLTILSSDGTPRLHLRSGFDLPVSPIVATISARLRGTSTPQILLATAGSGLILLDPTSTTPVLHQLLPANPEARNLTALAALSTGDLLLGTQHHGVLLYNGTTLVPLHFTLTGTDPKTLQVTAIAATGPADILIGTRNAGIFYLHAGTVDHADTTTGLPDNEITAITASATHAYIGTPTGTADFDLTSPAFHPSRILASNLFSNALALTNDELHIGTLDQGIHPIALTDTPHLTRASITFGPTSSSTQRIDAFLPTPTTLYVLADGDLLRHDANAWLPALAPNPNTLTDRNISALAFAPDGALYIGFFDHGIDLLRPDSSVHHLEDDHLFCINRLALDPVRRTIAAATANGLVLFDANGNPRQTLTRRDGLISDHITDIAFTRSGTTLATPAGLTFLSPTGPESLYAFQGLVNNHVYALAYSDSSNQLLAGTLGGLSLLQSTSVQRSFTATNSTLRHNWITALQALPNNTTLVGTYGAGLETLDHSGRFTPIDLPSNTPRDLVINPNALLATPTHIFAGTLAHGMLVYTVASGRWSSITTGLPSLNVTAFAARSGTLYIGTENGLVRIPEANIP